MVVAISPTAVRCCTGAEKKLLIVGLSDLLFPPSAAVHFDLYIIRAEDGFTLITIQTDSLACTIVLQESLVSIKIIYRFIYLYRLN